MTGNDCMSVPAGSKQFYALRRKMARRFDGRMKGEANGGE